MISHAWAVVRSLAVLPVFAVIVGCRPPEAPMLQGVESVSDPLPYEVDAQAPVSLLLSRTVFPAEDGHLDAIVWLGGEGEPDPDEEIRFELYGTDGRGLRLLRHERLDRRPAPVLFVSVAFPAALAGRSGELRVVRVRNGAVQGEATQAFEIAAPSAAATAGRVRLTVPNTGGAVLRGAPMTVGVPFPRGALADEGQVRLVDERGAEIPLQTRVTSRWSRFGPIRWLLCDFAVDVDGAGRELFLEYGPGVRRGARARDWVGPVDGRGFPHIEAGPLRIDADGVHFDAAGTGNYAPVLDADALRGAFVGHENGKLFRMPADTVYRIEESGPEKTVVWREGWYRDPQSGEEFCRFVTRFVVYRDSPLLRIFHTWIFTGDAWEDRIANMGWRFPAAGAWEPAGFLGAWGGGGEWLQGEYLLQHDYDAFRVHAGAAVTEGDRAPGVFAARIGDVRLTVGNKHFWQNFPHELGFEGNALVYYMWPRHGQPSRREVTEQNALRLWFAHEGEQLDFAVPRAYYDPEVPPDFRLTREHLDNGEYLYTLNAQGAAKTAELWLLFEPAGEPTAAPGVMGGLEDDTLRAVVDPHWQAASGVFYEIHPEDRGRYPVEEAVYEQHALAPYRWIEQLHVYGKWIWGDMVWAPDLRNRTTSGIYRGFRKSHQGWPYPWMPYARSGDPRYFMLADAATRYMCDVPYVHYADERAVRSVSAGGGRREDVPRGRGRWERHGIPWGHHRYWDGPVVRGYSDRCDYLWHSYYMTGYHRARDVAMDWGALTKEGGPDHVFAFPRSFDFSRCNRISVTLLQSYVEMYEATFDPWFLAAAHQIAEHVHLKAFADDIEAYADRSHGELFSNQRRVFDMDRGEYEPRVFAGHPFHSGSREFLRFTGCPRYREFYLHYARIHDGQGRGRGIEPVAHAYLLTGDEFFLRRARHGMDWTRVETYDGAPDYMIGLHTRGVISGASGFIYTPYYLKLFPHALFAMHRAGGVVQPEPRPFFQAPFSPVRRAAGSELFEWNMPTIAIRKDGAEALPLLLRVNQEGRPDEGKAFAFTIEDGSGSVVRAGEWPNPRDTLRVAIPAEAPPGVYRVRVRGLSNHRNRNTSYGNRSMPMLEIPLSPPGTPEVMEPAPGEGIGESHYEAQHWFRVPAGADTLEIEVGLEPFAPRRSGLVRVAVWNESLEPVWMEQFDQARDPDRLAVRARIPVPEGQAGRLWRVTAPFFHLGIELDERIPRIFSVSPERWFDPSPQGGDPRVRGRRTTRGGKVRRRGAGGDRHSRGPVRDGDRLSKCLAFPGRPSS